MIDEIRRSMPELPAAKLTRFQREYGITAYDADVLTATQGLADYFEAAVKAGAPAKTAANWISVELLRRLNDARKDISRMPRTPESLAELLRTVDSGRNYGWKRQKGFRRNV